MTEPSEMDWKFWCSMWDSLDSDEKVEWIKCLAHRMGPSEAEHLFSEIEDIPVIKERLTMRGYK